MATATTADNISIPSELTKRPQWVTWRREMRDGKLTKVPYIATLRGQLRNAITRCKKKEHTGKDCGCAQKTWRSFDDARQTLALHADELDGIGYVFAKDDPYAGVDLDHCRDKETGEIAEWARIVIDSFASYAEISQSGTGVHIILQGRMPGGKGHKRGNYEAYSQGRFFVFTGQHLKDTPATIEERQAELDGFTAHYLSRPETKRATAPEHSTCAAEPLTMDDEELLMRARNNPDPVKAARFQRLYDAGDISGYKSQSEADAALCNDLAYMCGPNAEERVAALFRRSALYREKAERDDYLTSTIALAYDGRTKFYTPRTVVEKSIEKNAPAFASDVLEALDADALDAGENQLNISLPQALARIRELEQQVAALEQENVRQRQNVASMNGKIQDIRNIIDADGLHVGPLEKVLAVDLLLNTFYPAMARNEGRAEDVRILIETPCDPKTGEKIKNVVGLADKHGASRGTISKSLDILKTFGDIVTRTEDEVTPKGPRSYTVATYSGSLNTKAWIRPDGPRKQMGGARPGAGRKAKCATPGCEGELVERRGVETKEHEFVETACTGVCGQVTRRYTGVVTSKGSRWVGENQLIFDDAPEVTGTSGNQLIFDDADDTSDTAGDESTPPQSVEASIVHKIENKQAPTSPPCPTCGGETTRTAIGWIVCRSCVKRIGDAAG